MMAVFVIPVLLFGIYFIVCAYHEAWHGRIMSFDALKRPLKRQR